MEWAKRHYASILLGLIGLASFYLVVILGFWVINKENAYPQTSVAGINVSGKSQTEIEAILAEETKEYLTSDVQIFPDGSEKIKASEVVSFDFSGTAKKVILAGDKNPFTLGVKRDFPLEVVLNDAKVFEVLSKSQGKLRIPFVPAKISTKNNEAFFEPGQPGLDLNFSDSVRNLRESAQGLRAEWSLAIFETRPRFTVQEFERLRAEITSRSKVGIVLVDKNNKYEVGPETVLSWVNPQSRGEFSSNFSGDEYYWPQLEAARGSIFSDHLISLYLSELSTKIDQEPQNALLSSSGGKVVVTKNETVGRALLVSESTSSLVEALNNKEEEAELFVEETRAEIRSDNLAELGLSEHLSRGYSNFAGSPANRRHNIKVGASRFNGYLIRPDEKFSFVKVLGPVDASTGYLPELVIKDNKTIPEYGGGMCQVSSTNFRAALNAGLPILERRAHSYPVSYYKPYGVDATIYIPKPDLVFKNDTGKYILIQTSIVGNNLYFDFYGTKDKRVVSFAGNEAGVGAVPIVEKISPLIYDQGARGNGSFTAVFWRFIVDESGKKITSKFTSKYDSPDKYPH